jgi:hypothetical protein
VGDAAGDAAGRPPFCSVKKRTQLGSTDLGSAVYCSYICSISQAFAPKSSVAGSVAVAGLFPEARSVVDVLLDSWSGAGATIAFFRSMLGAVGRG